MLTSTITECNTGLQSKRSPMSTREPLLLLLLLLLLMATGHQVAAQLEDIRLPAGFTITAFATNLPNARSLAISGADSRVVYVSTRQLSNVYACVDADRDGQADTVTTVISDKPTPNGIAWRDGNLFVVTPTSVWRYSDVDQHALDGTPFPAPTLVFGEFPSQQSHAWRYAAFGPDGKLYVAIGADCNVCIEELPFASLQRLDLETLQVETVAQGIRNTVGFAWHPDTQQLWFTDNGRDMMGDNIPDCELNVIDGASAGIPNYGYPFCHTVGSGDPYNRDVGPGTLVADPSVNANGQVDCGQYIRAVQALGPHVAPLGMDFYTGSAFPAEYNRSVFIALHGSWNRAQKIGYQVTRVVLDSSNRAVSHEPFATGWLEGQSAWGRPVDVAMHPDGSLLVSDDGSDMVYRIAYTGQVPTPTQTASSASTPPRGPATSGSPDVLGAGPTGGSSNASGTRTQLQAAVAVLGASLLARLALQ
eukprot:jgi/Tetstr1/446448/TSEL_033990.t1